MMDSVHGQDVVSVMRGNRAMCSCHWVGRARFLVARAIVDAQLHAASTGHTLASPLVWKGAA